MGDEVMLGGRGIRLGAGGALRDELLPTWRRLAESLAEDSTDRQVVTWMARAGAALPNGVLLDLDQEPVFREPAALAFLARVFAAHAMQLTTVEHPLPHVLELRDLILRRLGRPPVPQLELRLDEVANGELELRRAEIRLASILGSVRPTPEDVLGGFDQLLALLECRGVENRRLVDVLMRRAEWCIRAGLKRAAITTYQRLAAVDEEESDRAMWRELAASVAET